MFVSRHVGPVRAATGDLCRIVSKPKQDEAEQVRSRRPRRTCSGTHTRQTARTADPLLFFTLPIRPAASFRSTAFLPFTTLLRRGIRSPFHTSRNTSTVRILGIVVEQG